MIFNCYLHLNSIQPFQRLNCTMDDVQRHNRGLPVQQDSIQSSMRLNSKLNREPHMMTQPGPMTGYDTTLSETERRTDIH